MLSITTEILSSTLEGFNRRLKIKTDWFHICWRRNIACPQKSYIHQLFICMVIFIQVWDKEGEPRNKEGNWMGVQFNFKVLVIVLMLNILDPSQSKQNPSQHRSSPALTLCKLDSHSSFFLPPWGIVVHSWQEEQIGFKAALSRLKNEPSNPEQMEFCVLFSRFLFPQLISPTLPLSCSPSAALL